jgi:hypothetical protein
MWLKFCYGWRVFDCVTHWTTLEVLYVHCGTHKIWSTAICRLMSAVRVLPCGMCILVQGCECFIGAITFMVLLLLISTNLGAVITLHWSADGEGKWGNTELQAVDSMFVISWEWWNLYVCLNHEYGICFQCKRPVYFNDLKKYQSRKIWKRAW